MEINMKNFTLNKLWDLRAELDNAIINGEYDKIKLVKEKYEKLVDGEYFYSDAFMSYNFGFWNNVSRQVHVNINIDSILENIKNYEKKYVNGEDVSVKLKEHSVTSFLAGEIWVLRAMYDKFLFEGKNNQGELESQHNMILGKAVRDRLQTLVYSEYAREYYQQIALIVKEVGEGYKNIYGKKQPKLNYSQFAEDYLER